MKDKIFTLQDMLIADSKIQAEKEKNRDYCAYKLKYDDLKYPDVTRRGKALDTVGNLKWLLKQFNILVKYNQMSRRREVIIPNVVFLYEESENSAREYIYDIATKNEFPNKHIDNHLDSIAWENAYHPICEALTQIKWDGKPRLDDFIKTVKTTNDTLSYDIIKTWMTAAIAAAFSEKGFANQGVLVLKGKQRVGKTSFAKSLDPLNCGAVKEGALLDPKSKDDILAVNRHWIVELGELDSTLRKADVGRLKGFITNQVDYVRAPYARKDTAYVRRTAFIATVNEDNFLVDTTGNRRWWVIEIEKINLDHGIDMLQVWAEVYSNWRAGAPTNLNEELQEQVNETNREYEHIDPLEEKILTFYDWNSPMRKRLTATEILQEINWKHLNQSTTNNISRILRKINGMRSIKSNGKRLHEVPAHVMLKGFI